MVYRVIRTLVQESAGHGIRFEICRLKANLYWLEFDVYMISGLFAGLSPMPKKFTK